MNVFRNIEKTLMLWNLRPLCVCIHSFFFSLFCFLSVASVFFVNETHHQRRIRLRLQLIRWKVFMTSVNHTQFYCVIFILSYGVIECGRVLMKCDFIFTKYPFYGDESARKALPHVLQYINGTSVFKCR